MDVHTAWKSTCKILLGGEVGELEEYKTYLYRHVEPLGRKKSEISGREVAVSRPERFCQGAKFIAEEEWQAYDAALKKKAALSINDIKDVDSALRALGESLYYSGNIVLGNSAEVAGSDMCANATYVLDSHEVYDSKYIAYSHGVRYCESMFGCSTPAECTFSIKNFISRKSARCFEVFLTHFSSDCYYAANMEGCIECMFSFNQRSKSHMIGNLQLSREQYARLKNKLQEDIRETLRAKKEVPTIFELVGGKTDNSGAAARRASGKAAGAPAVSLPFENRRGTPEYAEIARAFGEVTEVVLGKALENIDEYGGWLLDKSNQVIRVKSAISEKGVYVAGWPYFKPIAGVAVQFDEALELGKKSISLEDAESLALQNASEKLMRIKFTTPETMSGRNLGMLDCGVYFTSSYCYRNSSSVDSKYCAYSLWPRESEHCFGCYFLFSSSFCLRCHNSSFLTRCFEVNHSKSCTDSYFCHNCENVYDSMFCFNAKNLRYAIGNVAVGREKYLEIKRKVLSGIVGRLEKGKKLEASVFNLGCGGHM